MSVRISLLLCGLLAAATVARAADKASGDIFPYKVHEATLENGFKTVVIPYDSPGTVAFYLVVRTGSRDEVEPGHSGFAHFFEHMMFRGTEKYSTEAYNDLLKRMGAGSNANTSDDRTVYHIVGPASSLETMMDMESDRFQNLKYTEDAFRTEALAILGEYNKNVSNPVQPMYEKMRDLAYTKHTYKHTTMGFLEDIKAMPGYYEYSLGFFDRFYRPENTTLVVVGDVKPQQAFEMAKKYFGSWKKGYQAPKVEAEPPQTGHKKAHIDWPNPVRPHLMMGYHIPAFSTASTDSATLDLIGQLLFSESAPLYQELVVEKQWVDFIAGGPDVSRDPGLFAVYARVKSEDLVPKVKSAIDGAVQQLAAEPVDAKRLERIKAHLRYSFARGLDTPGGVAAQVAEAIAATGEVSSINESFAQYQKVTPADVQRMVKATFRTANETLVSLSHKAPQEKPAAGAQGGANHE
ncbi:MAG TPA: pitrilysin family protein [Thermoanaerobaculia bacterium]|nr:pitrilysin family protein [Thermoanaerobaculia bacterium]